ncbi:MAG TPA: beta-ketoacyl reductase, partial [Candidatus Acidoferrum sp.]|nr:beta-ketoacyl reductase [Candidatus Acidoferrum sp.]
DHGARHLILVGRSAVSPEAHAAVRRLEQRGVHVRVARADVTRYDELAGVIADVRASMAPLRGTIHSAGTLNDGILLQQDAERFASVLGPKVDGAWNLHRLTCDLPLDFFVMFASAASVWGSPGQANHAAANAFLDALAMHRRAKGLPAISIDWGPWSDIGAAAARNVGESASAAAIAGITPEEGLRALERILREAPPRTVVARVKWAEFERQFGAVAKRSFFAEVIRDRDPKSDASVAAAPAALLERVRTALPGERGALVFDFVHGLAAKVLGVNASRKLNPRQPLNELGLDSIMALELRNSLAIAAARSLPATLLFDYPTLETVTAFLLQEIAPDLPATASPDMERPDPVRAEIELLSEDEAEDSLLRELDHAGY